MIDLLIRNGTVIDGTGAPRWRADIGVRGGVIVSVGPTDEPATRVVDADGLVVAPGFVDLHTHYDAQLFWDPTASPSPLHGVTTVFGGNCGFSLAPAEGHADYLMRMMARVEGMPLEALEAGLSWDWASFGDWLDRLDGHTAVNAGFLVGHSALRRVVMGEGGAAEASPVQIAEMQRLLAGALAAGALGFSTSTAPTHNDAEGAPVPSRFASTDELIALAGVLASHRGTTVELILAGCLSTFSDAEIDLITSVSLAARRPVNWNVLGVNPADPARHEHQLAASDAVAARGGRLVALTLPHSSGIRLSFLTGFVLDGLPGWRPVMGLPPDDRMVALADPVIRAQLAAGARSPEAGVLAGLARWEHVQFAEVFAPSLRHLTGRAVGEVAAEAGKDPFDLLLDVVVADGLRTGLKPGGAVVPAPPTETELAVRRDVWTDPRTAIGGSDAGAHLDMMCGAVYSTALLAQVRETGVLTLEEAVHELSDVPARLYGLKGRGTIAAGRAADLVLFDPDTVGFGSEHTRADLPGGASRLYAEATGVDRVLVNGVEIVAEGSFTGAVPGTLLRSGTDTETVPVPGTPSVV